MLPQRAAGSNPLKACACRRADEVGWRGVPPGQPTDETVKLFLRANWPSNEAVWGRGARTGEGGGTFFPLPPSLSACPVCPCLRFWCNPTVRTAQSSGLLKQPNQVELSCCKCSPSGVSHFQGPHEHMRHSCETDRRKRGGRYVKLQTVHFVHPTLVFSLMAFLKIWIQFWLLESQPFCLA